MIRVRLYSPGDFRAVLDLINAAAEADRTRRLSEAILRPALGNDTINQAAVAVVMPGKPVVAGFMWWDIYRGETLRLEGWVHPRWRRKGVGTALLTTVESFVRGQELLPVTLTGRIYSDIPGAETLFLRRGYQAVRRFYRMSAQLTGRHFESAPPPGIVLRSFRPDDLQSLVEADNEIFAGHWESYPRTLRAWKREMIERRPHDPALWVLAWDGDNIEGECLCHLSTEVGPENGWISIVGVRPEWRGRGLGRAVLTEGLRRLQEAGFATASLHVDSDNQAAVSLYRNMGMAITRTRLHFAKTIND